MTKGLNLQEDITILNVYSPNNRESKYLRQTLLEQQGEIVESTVRVGDFSMPLSQMVTFTRQKVSEDRAELNSTVNQLDINDICRLLHPTRADYRFFSSSRGTVTKIDHILGRKTDLKK